MAEIDFGQGTNELLSSSWGRIRLFASQVTTDCGRTQVVHELSSGDDHPVQDRGLRTRRTRMRLQFDDFPGAPSPRDAALELEAAKNTGVRQIFTHPLLGRFLASIGDFTSTIDENSVISAEVEFIKESDDEGVTPTGAASSGTSGESSVAQAAEALDAELADVGMLKMGGPTLARSLSVVPPTSARISLGGSLAANLSLEPSIDLSVDISVELTKAVSASVDVSVALAAAAGAEAAQGLFAATTIDARVSVTAWNAGDVPTRQIVIDAARISNNIATAIEVGGFERDLQLWPAFRASIMLGEAVRSAAIAATSETPAVFVMRVVARTALLPLAARVYGGADATDRARQISSLNDISTPGWLAPGDYLMPARPAAQRSAF